MTVEVPLEGAKEIQDLINKAILDARDEGALAALAAIRGQMELREKVYRKRRDSHPQEDSPEEYARQTGYIEASLGAIHAINEACAGVRIRATRRLRKEAP